MNIISQNVRYLPHDLNTKLKNVMTYQYDCIILYNLSREYINS